MTTGFSKLKLIRVSALLCFVLQVFALNNLSVSIHHVSDFGASETHQSLDQKSDNKTIARTLADFSSSQQDSFPTPHSHCGDCSSGTCCATIDEPMNVARPVVKNQEYMDNSSLWFYEHNSSQLRPPSST